MDRVEKQIGLNTIDSAANLGIGYKEYNLIKLDGDDDTDGDDTDGGNTGRSSFVNLSGNLILLILLMLV